MSDRSVQCAIRTKTPETTVHPEQCEGADNPAQAAQLTPSKHAVMYFLSLSLYLCILQSVGESQLNVITHACRKDGVKHSDGLSHTCIEDIASVQDLQTPPDYVTVS